MEIKNRMKYFITDRLGTYEVFPLGESEYSISFDRQNDEQLDYDVSLDGKMMFVKEAYARLMSFEGGGYRCEEMVLSVKKDCTSGLIPIRAFSISLNEGSFDLDKCTITMKVLKDSKDKCISDNKTNKVNLLNLIGTGNRVVVKPFMAGGGTYEYRTCQKSTSVNAGDSYGFEIWCNSSSGMPTDNTVEAFDNNWQVLSNLVRMDGSLIIDPGTGLGGGTIYRKTTWVREIVTIDCAITPDPEWVLVQDNCALDNTKKYAKKAELYGCQTINNNYTDQWNFYYTSQCNVAGSGVGGNGFPNIDNGILLKDALIELVKSACPALTVKSDFFQINPENPSSVNYVTGLESTTNEIVIFQKSDVKRPLVYNNATKFEIQFEKFTQILKMMFNVKWRIDGNLFRIEHVSYYNKSMGIDVVNSPELMRYFKGKRVYSYESEKIPQKEVFDFKERGYNPDWNTTIEYTGCVTNNKDNITNYIVDEATSDVAYCLANPDPESNLVTDEGFVIVSTKKVAGVYYIRNENGYGGRIMNNVFSFDKLVRDFHHYDRPMKTGKVDGDITVFETTIPTKKGDKFSIPLCVCDGLFDPDELVNTPLGEGIVSSATWRFRDQVLELELLYESNQDLVYNIPPVLTGGGNYFTYQDVPINIPISASDVDGFIIAININYAPQNGTITIDPSFTFITYTPNAGYSGLDLFALVALDNFNEPSNIINFGMTVRTANNPPVAVNDEYFYYVGETWTQGTSILANDSDDWNAMTLVTTSTTSAQGVAITIDSLGFFSYTPPSGFVGDDTFSYTIQDDLGNTSSAVVTIKVRNYHYPIANDDFYTCKLDTVLDVDGTIGKPKLVTNDTTPDGITYTYTATAGIFATDNGGSVTILSDGKFTYTPPSGFTGQDHFTYTVSNGVGTDTGDVYIDVVPALYVQMTRVEGITGYHALECGDPPQGTLGGLWRERDFILKFWQDSAKTIPYDTTGKHIHILITETVTTQNYNDPIQTSSYDWATDEVLDIQYMVYDDAVYFDQYNDCNGFPSSKYTMNLTVKSAQWYTIVT